MVSVKDTGFAQFTSGLICGVLDAVIQAQVDQTRKLAEINSAVQLDDQAFALAYVSEEQVTQAQAAAGATEAHADPDATRLALARTQRALLQAALARGLPRVVVDHGRVSARLMFQVDSGTSPSPTSSPTSSPTTGLAHALRASPRLSARPVQAHDPAFLRLQTQITGEVEITFKTVTD
jgi:hypothetical protein